MFVDEIIEEVWFFDEIKDLGSLEYFLFIF